MSRSLLENTRRGPGRTTNRIASWLVLSLVVSGCAPTLPPGLTGQVDARPPLAQCEGVRAIDWRRFDPWADRFARGDTTGEAERIETTAQRQAAIDRIRIADDAPHRPSDEAVIVIRAFVGAFQTEHLGMAWREPDGRWWVWNQRLAWSEPLPPPPPPWEPQGPALTTDVRFPPVSGRMPDEMAARMEALRTDPCRALEPDGAPWFLPLRQPDPGNRSRERECPSGGAPIIGEITESGQPPRLIFYPCNQTFITDRMLTLTAYAAPGRDPDSGS